jgi:hypothetical protein
LRARRTEVNQRLVAKLGALFYALSMVAGTPSVAQQKPKVPAGANQFCDQPNIKKIILNALNGSVEFEERKIKLIDFQSDKLLSADPAKNSFSCHGVMFLSGGQKFSGVLTMAAPGDKTDIDWYDDDAENGLVNFNKSSMPADEGEFIKIVTLARGAYDAAKTEFTKGAIRPQRAKAICATLKSTQTNNWIGKLVRLTTNSDGKGVLAIEIAPSVTIKTFSTQLSDIGSKTLVEPDTKLYSALGELSEGDQVKFSGSFFTKSADCFEEASLTMNGALTSPEFIMRFANVQKTSP